MKVYSIDETLQNALIPKVQDMRESANKFTIFAASFHIPPNSLIISEPRNPTKLYKIQSLSHTTRPHYANNPMYLSVLQNPYKTHSL